MKVTLILNHTWSINNINFMLVEKGEEMKQDVLNRFEKHVQKLDLLGEQYFNKIVKIQSTTMVA